MDDKNQNTHHFLTHTDLVGEKNQTSDRKYLRVIPRRPIFKWPQNLLVLSPQCKSEKQI